MHAIVLYEEDIVVDKVGDQLIIVKKLSTKNKLIKKLLKSNIYNKSICPQRNNQRQTEVQLLLIFLTLIQTSLVLQSQN